MAERPKKPDGDEALRAAYLRRIAEGGAGHLQAADWERLACDEMVTEERERALEHVTSCADCADAYRGVSMLQAEAPAFDRGAPRAPRARPPLWPRVPGWARLVAAGLAGASLLSWGLHEKRSPAPPVTRAPASGTALALLEPLGTVSHVPGQFRWRALDAAESYRVRLFRDDGLLLWTSEPLTDSRADWPGSVSLSPGRYFWDVEALREGRSLARSQLQAFVRSP